MFGNVVWVVVEWFCFWAFWAGVGRCWGAGRFDLGCSVFCLGLLDAICGFSVVGSFWVWFGLLCCVECLTFGWCCIGFRCYDFV